jgi:hypothetical protein
MIYTVCSGWSRKEPKLWPEPVFASFGFGTRIWLRVQLKVVHIYFIKIHLEHDQASNVCKSVGSSYKRKFVVFPFVDEETNGSYLFANGLNALVHLWKVLPHTKFCHNV